LCSPVCVVVPWRCTLSPVVLLSVSPRESSLAAVCHTLLRRVFMKPRGFKSVFPEIGSPLVENFGFNRPFTCPPLGLFLGAPQCCGENSLKIRPVKLQTLGWFFRCESASAAPSGLTRLSYCGPLPVVSAPFPFGGGSVFPRLGFSPWLVLCVSSLSA